MLLVASESECVINICAIDFTFSIVYITFSMLRVEWEFSFRLLLVKGTLLCFQDLGMSWKAKRGVANAQKAQMNSTNCLAQLIITSARRLLQVSEQVMMDCPIQQCSK